MFDYIPFPGVLYIYIYIYIHTYKGWRKMWLYTRVSNYFCSNLLLVYFLKYGLINNKAASHDDKTSDSYSGGAWFES